MDASEEATFKDFTEQVLGELNIRKPINLTMGPARLNKAGMKNSEHFHSFRAGGAGNRNNLLNQLDISIANSQSQSFIENRHDHGAPHHNFGQGPFGKSPRHSIGKPLLQTAS